MVLRVVEAVLTIGHSRHPVETLVELLRAQGVEVVVDVRSQPYSRFNRNANREPMAAGLKAGRIDYVFLGRELGARSADPSCYENGQVLYRRLAQTVLFKQGLKRVIDLASDRRVALLCAEKEPLGCHRTLLVAPELVAVGVAVAHIHSDGSIEAHSDAMSRLVRELGMPDFDMLRSRDELIADACAAQEKRIAFVDAGMRVGVD